MTLLRARPVGRARGREAHIDIGAQKLAGDAEARETELKRRVEEQVEEHGHRSWPFQASLPSAAIDLSVLLPFDTPGENRRDAGRFMALAPRMYINCSY